VADKTNIVNTQQTGVIIIFYSLIYGIFIRPLAFLNKNPIMLKTNSFQIVYFGLFAACGVIASLSISFFYLNAKGSFSDLAPIPTALILVSADLIGVKVLYFLALGKNFLLNPKTYLNETTMYNQGGLFGVVIAAAAIAFIKHIDPLIMFDAMVLGGSFGLFLGRLGCYNYGCCFGIPTNNVIHVKYHPDCSKIVRSNPELKGVPLVPTQIYSAYFDLFLFIVSIVLALINRGNGFITLAFIFLFNAFRVTIQRFRFVEKSDLAGFSKIAILYLVIGLVMWVSLFIVNGGRIVSRPFQAPFTFKAWAQFITRIDVILSLLITGTMSFLFYGIHGKELGTHTNLRSE
jgi:prolipoprotein diacylglyceryltransferase